jgi:Signal transduction histidine kinase
MKEREMQPSWLETAAGRLRRNRVLLAAAAASLLAVDLFLGGRGIAAMLAVAFVLAVAVLLPEREGEGKPNATGRNGTEQAGALSAVDLAAVVQDPLYIFDRTGAVLHANEAATLAFGPIAPGGSLQLKFRAPEIHAFIGHVLEGKEAPPAIDYIERVPFERAYRVAAMPIGGEGGLYVLLFRDQSEARRIDRMRTDFIANASHELRTPLASIAGFIETLRGPARNDAKARDNFLQIMQEQTARMARLIDDLLSLSRLEAKPYVRPTERVDLGRLLREVSDSLSHLATETGVAIKLDLPEAPLEVTGNRDELVQVFANLLENACKYGSSGGRVTVQARREKPGAETAVTVTDFGPGIPQEHIPRITERFYRVDVETSRAQKGTGLGLAIVKHILTRHGARLSIRSKVGEGSSFTVHFPPG